MGGGSNLNVGIHVRSRKRSSRVLVGLFLIGLGSLLLAQKLGAIEWARIDRLWPAALYALAVVQLLEGKLGEATFFGVFGTWFFACVFHWWGLTWVNSWPVALLGIGASIAIGALTGEDEKERAARRRDGDPS